MKKSLTFIALVLIVVLCICLTACNSITPWDNLGGGGTAESTDESTINSDDYQSADLTISDEQNDATTEGATKINLSDLDAMNIEGVYYSGSTLTFSKAGSYILSGSLEGNVVVTGVDGTVKLILDNASISTPSDSADATIVFEKNSGLRIITLADGSVNTLSDSVGDTDLDGDGAVIQAKKSSLTINGAGKLILNAIGESASGIKAKKEVYILGSTIEINAVKNGIKGDSLVYLSDSFITVTADNDAIKTDIEASTTDEAQEYSSDKNLGYIFIHNTSLYLTAGDDGISGNNCIYIDNRTNDIINIVTNGGAPTTVTESSSDNASGKAIKTGGIKLVISDTEEDIKARYEENYGLVILGGTFKLNSNDDAISSKGNVIISGGDFEIASGDDAIHAEYLSKITNGKIYISKSYEGIEGAQVEITGGEIDITSSDDGINAANGDLKNFNFYIRISGGDIKVNASGDGIDSNGTVQIEGGTIIVNGPTDSGNGALDSDNGVLMNGGNLIAFGSLGMVEVPANNSGQCYISLSLSKSVSAGTSLVVYDSKGNQLFSTTPIKSFQSVIISLTSFTKGETYTISVGGDDYTATLNSVGTALGVNTGGNGNQGFNPNFNRPNR